MYRRNGEPKAIVSLSNNLGTMTVVIKQGMSKRQIEAALKKLKPRRRKRRALPDIRQFANTITLKEDPMEIQRKMRDEWS